MNLRDDLLNTQAKDAGNRLITCILYESKQRRRDNIFS